MALLMHPPSPTRGPMLHSFMPPPQLPGCSNVGPLLVPLVSEGESRSERAEKEPIERQRSIQNLTHVYIREYRYRPSGPLRLWAFFLR